MYLPLSLEFMCVKYLYSKYISIGIHNLATNSITCNLQSKIYKLSIVIPLHSAPIHLERIQCFWLIEGFGAWFSSWEQGAVNLPHNRTLVHKHIYMLYAFQEKWGKPYLSTESLTRTSFTSTDLDNWGETKYLWEMLLVIAKFVFPDYSAYVAPDEESWIH